MRSAALSLTLMTALAVTPALAQTSGQGDLPQQGYPAQNATPAEGAGVPMGELPAPPSHQPMSRRATNLGPGTSHGIISPSLPSSGLGPNASATEYLAVAESALNRNRTGLAQSALENAETYLLNRSVPQNMANQPDQSPAVQTISSALQALGTGDTAQARQLTRQAIQQAQQEQMAMQAGGPTQASGTGLQPGMTGYGGGYPAGMGPGQPGMAQPPGGAYPPGPASPGPAVVPPPSAYPPPGAGMAYPPPPPR